MNRILLLTIFLTLGACNVEHELYLDNKPLTLIVRNLEASSSKLYTIKPGSNEYIALNNWLNKNRSEWKQEPVKWLSPYEVYSDNYRIQFSSQSAVIKLKNNDKYTMWRKKIDKSLVDIFNGLKNT